MSPTFLSTDTSSRTTMAPLQYFNKWHMPLYYHDSHLYAAMSFPHFLFYTPAYLEKMHRQFGNPPASKIFNLLKRVGTEAAGTKTFSNVSVTLSHDAFYVSVFTMRPCAFSFFIGHENVRFNSRAYIWHYVLTASLSSTSWTKPRAYELLVSLPKFPQTPYRESMILCWSSVYTGLPHHVMVDGGSQFRKILPRTVCSTRC